MTYQETSVEYPSEMRFPRTEERPEGSGTFVRISDGYLASIVYLGFALPNDEMAIDVMGTGFLVNYEGNSYIVTAAHVAALFNQCPFAVRLNRHEHSAGVDRVAQAKWYVHPDTTVDVAVLPYDPPKWASVSYVETKYAITEFKRESKRIGVGDLAHVVGVFRNLKGEKKNVPVVHTGFIASMADGETMEAEDWRPTAKDGDLVSISGYVIQVPTQRGSSGSPVFVRRSLEMEEAFVKQTNAHDSVLTKTKARNWAHGTIWFLGVWHGAWGQDIQFYAKTPSGKADWLFLNVGTSMGICTPATRMLETLDRPELKKMRLKKEAAKKAENKVTPQSMSNLNETGGDAILRAALSTAPLSKPKRKPKDKARRARVNSK